MKQYLELLRTVRDHGKCRDDRTGTGTIGIFGAQSRYDLESGFPLMTTKKLHVPSIVHELLWFISGDTNIKYLQDNGVRIWNEWADSDGNLGPVYGHQWRSWTGRGGETIDQLGNVVSEIKNNPTSRRLIVSAWNPGDLGEMALPPCHMMFQFYVSSGKLSCHLYQRSADMFLGVPFNIASYSLLTCMIANQVGLGVGEFIHTLGDAHIYLDHLEQVDLQLSREPGQLPRLVLPETGKSIFEYTADDIRFENYNPQPGIKAKVSV